MKPRHPPRILLARNTFANAGDEAMLARELQRLRDRFPEAALTLLTDDPEGAARRHAVDARPSEVVLGRPTGPTRTAPVRRALRSERDGSAAIAAVKRWLYGPVTRAYLALSCRAFVRSAARMAAGRRPIGLLGHQRDLMETLAEVDVVLAGGGLIPSLPALFRPRAALYRAAAELGVPVVLHGQSVLPDDRASEALRSVDRIVLRDDGLSRRHARLLGVAEDRLLDGVDPAHGLAPAAWEAVVERLDGPASAVRPGAFLAVNVRGWEGRALDAGYRAVARAVEAFAAEQGEPAVVLFGMQAYHRDHDGRALDRLAARFDRLRPLRLGGIGDPRLAKGLVGRARLIVCGRYHGALFALEQGVPAVGLSVGPEYDVKMDGVFRRYGVPDLLGSLVDPDEGWLRAALARAAADRPAISRALLARDEELAALRDAAYDAIEAILAEEEAGAGGADR